MKTPTGDGWTMVRWIVQHILIPLLFVMVSVGGYALSVELAGKKDSLEASREHSELREGLLRASLLRDQPPEWFIRWADSLDKRLQRIEERQP